MNRNKAEKLIRRKVARAKTCPFCGRTPEFDIRCDTEYSEHGSWGHYACRKPCCPATSSGQTELFFCNNWKRPRYSLWWNMACRLINNWNERAPQ